MNDAFKADDGEEARAESDNTCQAQDDDGEKALPTARLPQCRPDILDGFFGHVLVNTFVMIQ